MSAAVTKINALRAAVANQGTCKSYCPVCNCPVCAPLNADTCKSVCKPINVTTCASFINPTSCADELKKRFIIAPDTNLVATLVDSNGNSIYSSTPDRDVQHDDLPPHLQGCFVDVCARSRPTLDLGQRSPVLQRHQQNGAGADPRLSPQDLQLARRSRRFCPVHRSGRQPHVVAMHPCIAAGQ